MPPRYRPRSMVIKKVIQEKVIMVIKKVIKVIGTALIH